MFRSRGGPFGATTCHGARADSARSSSLLITVIGCALLVIGSCSRDPHILVIGPNSKRTFVDLVKNGKGLTSDEIALLTTAQARLLKTNTSDSVVGRSIGDVIADQRRWQAEHDRLTNDLQALYRAGKAIEASISVGVNFPKYGELVQALATELTIANDKVSTDEERHVAGLFQDSLGAYSDAATLWRHQIENAQYSDLFGGEVGYSIKHLVERPELTRIIEAYHVPLHDGQLKYRQGPYQSVPQNAMQFVWIVADQRLNAAVDAYVAK